MQKAILFLAALCLGASLAVAGEIGVPNRLAVAKVGEWASYRVPNGYTQKLTVVAREGDGPSATVTVRVDNIYDSQVVNSSEIVRDAGEPIEAPRVPGNNVESVEIETRTMTVLNRQLLVTIVDIEYDNGDDDDDDVEWYLSGDIPVFGIIKQVTDDNTPFELVEYGDN